MASNNTRNLFGFWDQFQGYSDPRVKDKPWMGTPWPTILISALYVVGVGIIGPRVMRSRDPVNPTKLILIYNALQIGFSLWLFLEAGFSGWFNGYNFLCEPFHYSMDPKSIRMANISWWFFISKFTEFVDTIFLVLRKKFESVSVLHVVHHGIMPFCAWCMANTTPVGHATMTGFINPLVHFIMYIYYFIAALGPHYHKYIWWKKYLTTIQMIQFLITLVHSCALLFTDCDYPVQAAYLVIFLSLLFLTLFVDFYIKDRRKRQLIRSNKSH